jgi:hypothetical protein
MHSVAVWMNKLASRSAKYKVAMVMKGAKALA